MSCAGKVWMCQQIKGKVADAEKRLNMSLVA